MEVTSLIMAILAVVVSISVGIAQFVFSKAQYDFQNKVELYLSINLNIGSGIIIQNIGANVVYLDKYSINGSEHNLNKEVLPSVSSCNVFKLLPLVPDNTGHASFDIWFWDWRNRLWKTKGSLEVINGMWKLTYTPCTLQRQNNQ